MVNPVFRSRVLLAVLLAAIAVLAFPGAASAAFPGANGSIVFTSFRDGNKNIYRVDSTVPGSPETQLTASGADDYQPFIDRLSTKVVFVSTRQVAGSGRERIWTMNIDGTNQVNVSTTAAADIQPAWSPDGTKIVFTSDIDGFKQIWIMNANGTGRQRLFAVPTAYNDSQPVWSPDGTKIAFVSARPSGVGPIVLNRIVIAPIDGTSQTIVTVGTNSDIKPDWKPDGTKLAFTANDSSGTSQVWTMNSDGTGRAQITSGDQSDEPTWSPDGSYIVFRRRLTATSVVTMAVQGPGNTPWAISPATSTNEEPNWGPLAPDLVVPEASNVWMLPILGGLTSIGAIVVLRRRRPVTVA